jgi:S-adenosylmethionine decarboxylase
LPAGLSASYLRQVNGGTEWVVDAFGCAADRLRDPDCARGLLDEIVAAMDLHVVGTPQVHAFGGAGGVTALYLLSESHLALHTFPETGVATLNLYCCRPRSPVADWTALAMRILGAAHVTVRELARGGDA